MLGFGSESKWCTGEINDYNNKTKDLAISEAKQFKADYGGTEIMDPLYKAENI